jgi:hypothetical protein
METKPAWESLEKLQAFPTYQDQAAAAAANAPGAKEYVANQDERHWYDPDPGAPSPFKTHFEVGAVPWVMYRFAFTGKMDADENGIVSSIAMPIAQAGKVNIMPSGLGMTNLPSTGRTVPVPMSRDLAATEKIRRQTPFSAAMIRNVDVMLPGEAAAQTVELMAVALAQANQKLDKVLAKLGIS